MRDGERASMGHAFAQSVRLGSRVAKRFGVFDCVDATYLGSQLRIRIHDVSASGLRLETQEPVLQAGDWVQVLLPIVGEQLGQVAWDEGRMVGLQFADDLSRDDLMGIIDAMRDRLEDNAA